MNEQEGLKERGGDKGGAEGGGGRGGGLLLLTKKETCHRSSFHPLLIYNPTSLCFDPLNISAKLGREVARAFWGGGAWRSMLWGAFSMCKLLSCSGTLRPSGWSR